MSLRTFRLAAILFLFAPIFGGDVGASGSWTQWRGVSKRLQEASVGIGFSSMSSLVTAFTHRAISLAATSSGVSMQTAAERLARRWAFIQTATVTPGVWMFTKSVEPFGEKNAPASSPGVLGRKPKSSGSVLFQFQKSWCSA